MNECFRLFVLCIASFIHLFIHFVFCIPPPPDVHNDITSSEVFASVNNNTVLRHLNEEYVDRAERFLLRNKRRRENQNETFSVSSSSSDLHLWEQHLLPVGREEQLSEDHLLWDGRSRLQRAGRLVVRRSVSFHPLWKYKSKIKASQIFLLE